MTRSLYIAATGMDAAQLAVDNIANNLANASTTAFKRGLINFQDLLYQTVTAPGAQTSEAGTELPSGIQFGLGVSLGSLYKAFEQGVLNPTPGVDFNVAISGPGLFQITLPDGSTAYTRDGAFQLSKSGELVNHEGFPLVPGLTIPDGAMSPTISSTGIVQVTVNSVLQNLGQIELARFINPAGLQAVGSNLYIETEASGAPVTGFGGDLGFGILKQYNLENSNVNSVVEITKLIENQRAFEYNSKVMQVSEHMLKTLVDTKA